MKDDELIEIDDDVSNDDVQKEYELRLATGTTKSGKFEEVSKNFEFGVGDQMTLKLVHKATKNK